MDVRLRFYLIAGFFSTFLEMLVAASRDKVELARPGKNITPMLSSTRIAPMCPRAVSVLFWLAITLVPAMAEVRISDDPGGQIGEYLHKLDRLRASGDRVIIDGTCASACTMILGRIPRNRICVTPGAVLAFHAAWDPTPSGGQQISRDGNRILWSTYPEYIRKWIAQHGGLNSQVLYLRGADLNAIYPPCR